ncbi:hypothetical protein NK718_09900 [Alsobacter sp. SYSU M60028]|uniref:Uncharacterized protein n=1 Tax=Alsobacter ponti TaxID=2962936 RepID=A0ABT1LBH0_9HYPH|nr:hypothetical protein [Alsobacter ponti]MCP8938827.1 hypothetical protein [Alsobacter ponti]
MARHGKTERKTARRERRPTEQGGPPPAGPHAKPELTDPDKTPGAGTLPEPRRDDVSSGTG